ARDGDACKPVTEVARIPSRRRPEGVHLPVVKLDAEGGSEGEDVIQHPRRESHRRHGTLCSSSANASPIAARMSGSLAVGTASSRRATPSTNEIAQRRACSSISGSIASRIVAIPAPSSIRRSLFPLPFRRCLALKLCDLAHEVELLRLSLEAEIAQDG